ncbi:MAG: hypothetical protein MPN21_23400 [Thermoanaerobaculia bacterium]|nr:hypothetical protein [Thermoanaerobaculia bacterium]
MTEASYSSLPPAPGGPVSSPGGRRGCDKLLIGCGLGCGLLVLTFGVLAVVLGMWATRPGTQHETTAVVSPDGVAVMKLRDIGEDPGVQAFLTNFLHTMNEASREAQRQDLPENLRWLVDMQGSNDSPAGLNMFFPRDVTLSIEPRDEAELAALEHPTSDDELAIVAAINFRSFVRPIRSFITWVIEQDARSEVRYHGDHKVLPMGADDWATFVDGTFFLSGSYSALVAALDRLDRGDVQRGWSGEVPQGDWDFFGVVEMGTDAMDVVFEDVRERNAKHASEMSGDGAAVALEVEEQPEVGGTPVGTAPVEPLQFAFGVDLKSADAVDGEMLYSFDSEADARVYSLYLEEEMEQLRLRGENEGLAVETSVIQDVSRVNVTLAVSGLEDKVAEMIDWFVTLDETAIEEIVREVEESAQDEEFE